MFLLLCIAFVIGSCLLVILLFGLVHAAGRADEGEEKILQIISSVPTVDITERTSEESKKQEPALAPRDPH